MEVFQEAGAEQLGYMLPMSVLRTDVWSATWRSLSELEQFSTVERGKCPDGSSTENGGERNCKE